MLRRSRDGRAGTVHADAKRRHSRCHRVQGGGTSKNLPPSSSSSLSLGRAGRAGMAPRTSSRGRRRRLEGRTTRLEIGCIGCICTAQSWSRIRRGDTLLPRRPTSGAFLFGKPLTTALREPPAPCEGFPFPLEVLGFPSTPIFGKNFGAGPNNYIGGRGHWAYLCDLSVI